MSRRWAVVLVGHEFDLQSALDIFKNGAIEVCETVISGGQSVPVLQSGELDQASSSAEADASARHLVTLLNGALFIAKRSRHPLSTGTILEADGDGGWRQHQVIHAKGMVLRAHMNAVIVQADNGGQSVSPPPPPAHVTLLGTAASDTIVTEVYSLLSGELTWVDLHRAIELMRDDLNKKRGDPTQKGNHNHSAIGWDGGLEGRITRAANVHRHSSARTRGDRASSVMSLDDARAGVQTLTQAWCQWRAGLQSA